MSELWSQVQAFMLTLLLGVAAGLVFHFYQLTIKNIRMGKYLLYLFDLLIWMMMIGIVFLSMLLINQGEMRIYVLIALIIGALIYFRILADSIGYPLSRCARVTTVVIENTVKVIRQPFIKLVRYLSDKIKKHDVLPPDEEP